jgi:superfamily I DNA/RNA helicase
MNSKIFNKHQVDLLNALANEYNNIFVVSGDDEVDVLIVLEYRTATQSNNYLTIKGFKSIMDVIKANSVYVNDKSSLKTVTTQIDSLPTINRERIYSDKYMWMKY